MFKKKVSLNKLEIYADPLLETAFLVLAENVIKFGVKATEITFTYTKDSEGLVLIFSDDGEGIPSENKKNIFEREYGERKGGGLFLAKEILDVTRITIKETGECGTGAKFEMFVPEGNYRFMH